MSNNGTVLNTVQTTAPSGAAAVAPGAPQAKRGAGVEKKELLFQDDDFQ